jgi:hygromycin-B 4-O-kinase
MSQKPNITIDKTSELLQEKFGGEVLQLTLLSGGEWSRAYSFVLENQKYVLRWCKSTDSFEKDSFASRFNSLKLPIPKITLQGKAFDTYYAVSTFASGNFIESLSATELASTLPALYELFDALRSADLSQTSGYGLWDGEGKGSHKSWKAYLLDVNNDAENNLTHGWKQHLQTHPKLEEVFSWLYEILEKQVAACPEARELIHSDLLNFNLLVSDHHISGVIDWQCSMYGDSLYDIAWFLYYAPWYPQFGQIGMSEKILKHFVKSAWNTENIDERLQCYYLHIGLGSIAYNAFKQDWKAAQDAGEYTIEIVTSKSKK